MQDVIIVYIHKLCLVILAGRIMYIADEFVWITKNLPEVKEVLIDDDTFT